MPIRRLSVPRRNAVTAHTVSVSIAKERARITLV